MQTKSKRLRADIDNLIANSRELYNKSESTHSVSFVTQANEMQTSAEAKLKEVEQLQKDIDEQQLLLKQL
jgi:hypothetical protein